MHTLCKNIHYFILLPLFGIWFPLQAADTTAFLKEEMLGHVDFDSGSPNDSRGFLKVTKTAPELKYVSDGGGGKAWLFSGDELIQYKPVAPLFQGTGAICFWIMPQFWLQKGKTDDRGLIVFLRAEVGKGSFIVERQGFSEKKKRRDYLLAMLNHVMTPMPLAVAASTEQWSPGCWHFIALNWDENGFSISTDGQKLHSVKYGRPLKKEDFTGLEKFYIGTVYGTPEEKTLLDELSIFKRPLTLPEIQTIYKNGLKQKTVEPAVRYTDKKKIVWNSNSVKSNVRIPLIDKKNAPSIDGTIHENEWKNAFESTGGYQDNIRLDSRQYSCYLSSDQEKIYIALRSELPPDGKLITNQQPSAKDNPLVGHDDSVELWFLPDMKNNSKIYVIQLNSVGALFDFCYDTGTKKIDSKWNSGVVAKSNRINGEWHIEAAIPVKTLGMSSVKENIPWGIRLVRNFNMPKKQVDWSPVSGAFVNPDTMGTVIWDNEAPLIRGVSLQDDQKKHVKIMFEASNTKSKSVSLRTDRYWENAGNTDNVISEKVILNPGESKAFPIGKTAVAGGEYHVIFRADSTDGKKNFFTRKFIWNSRGSENAWMVERSKSGAEFKYGYYPYTSQIRTSLDLSGVGDKGNIVSVSTALYNENGRLLFEKAYPSLQKNFSEMIITIPKLPEGKYTIKAIAKDFCGKEIVLEQGEFEHKNFPWEHNTLGISDEVIPPYKPLTRVGNSVNAVLRTYELNNCGLPEQIRSDGQNILAAPVSFKIEVNGKKETPKTKSGLQFTRELPNAIHYKVNWNAGKFQGKTNAFFDYDGMLKMTVDFALPGTEELSRFDLIIPVKNDTAKLMHVLSDTGKASFTGKVPTGSNPVWESMFIEHNSNVEIDNKVNRFPGTFVPYVWLGSENRGICWFANNDKDWLPDDKHSVVEFNRYPDRTEIVIHFVTRPDKLKRAHSITFALQATPTKPMMETPVNWRKVVFGLPHMKGLYHGAILGSAFHWGGDDYFTFKPRQDDDTIFRLMSLARRGIIPQDEWNTWMDGYNQKIPYLKTVKNGILSGKAAVETSPQTVIPYTDMRGISVREREFPIFKDEWLMGDYAPKKWNEFESGFGYCALTCKSRQDFILWCLNRMLESGALDGIYFDVTYPKASRNVVTGNAYYDDAGKLRTGCDLFESRELFKRCAVLSWQKRGYNLNIAHMSFTLIAPVHTWAGITLDWESRYGMEDFQDRFSREYIRTLSIGRQTGTIPLVCGSLGIHGESKARPHVERTLTGVAITHEVKDWAILCKENGVYYETLKKMYDFGYGQSDCKVYNYWNKDFPVTIRGIDYSGVALIRNGKMLLVVCDYGEGGNVELTLNTGFGLNKEGAMFDDENSKIKQINGIYSFPLPKHDFKIIYYK